VADQEGHPATARQLAVFDEVLSDLAGLGVFPSLVHAANSAGALAVPRSRRDLVRVGIALYGVLPAPCFRPDPGLRPVMSLRARVSFAKRVAAGEAVSYGLTYAPQVDSNIATIPLGYADGYSRRLSNCGEALVGGHRVPVAGTVTMDQTMLDCGDLDVHPGDEVVLLGRQGGDEISANEIAQRIGTIGYEVVSSIGKRVPRVYR
jgi:alanine racemase